MPKIQSFCQIYLMLPNLMATKNIEWKNCISWIGYKAKLKNFECVHFKPIMLLFLHNTATNIFYMFLNSVRENLQVFFLILHKNEAGTALSNHIWKLKDRNEQYTLEWSIKTRAFSFKSGSKYCDLCLSEKNNHSLSKPSLNP